MDEEAARQGRPGRLPLHHRRHPGAGRVPGDPLRARPLLRHRGLNPVPLRADRCARACRLLRRQPRGACARIRSRSDSSLESAELPAKATGPACRYGRGMGRPTHRLGGRAAVIAAALAAHALRRLSRARPRAPRLSLLRGSAPRRRLEPQDRAVAAARARRQRRGRAAHAGVGGGLGQRRGGRCGRAAARSCARSSTRFSPSGAARRRARSRPGSRTSPRTTTSPTVRSIAGPRSKRPSAATATTATASSCSPTTCCAVSASARTRSTAPSSSGARMVSITW